MVALRRSPRSVVGFARRAPWWLRVVMVAVAAAVVAASVLGRSTGAGADGLLVGCPSGTGPHVDPLAALSAPVALVVEPDDPALPDVNIALTLGQMFDMMNNAPPSAR